jgi:hypothetical protein
VVTMDGRHGVISLAEPEEDDAYRRRCWWDVGGVVDVAVSGEDVLLELGHVSVGDRGAGGVTHGAAVRLGIVDPQPLEVG